MKIIDVDSALGVITDNFRFSDPGGLYAMQDKYRISASLAYHADALLSPGRGNRAIRDIAAGSGGRIKPCYVINPSILEDSIAGEGTLIQKLRRDRPSAVRIFPTGQKYLLDGFYAGDMLSVFDALRLPVIVDANYDGTFWASLPSVAREFPSARFILLRVGLNHSRYIFPILKKLENVYFDMSIMADTGQIEEICARFGPERLLFGGGLPNYEPSGAMGLLMYADIPGPARQAIVHENFERLEAECAYDD